MAITVYLSTDGSAPTLNGNAGSLITVLDACLVNGYGAKSAAGWTKAYSGTNLAAYRQSTSGHAGFYLRVDDSASGAGTGSEALVRGYESMSDVNTGTDAFPTVALLANGHYWKKSSTSNGTSRPWALVADAGTFYFYSIDANTTAQGELYAFGSINSVTPSDPYNVICTGRVTANSTSTSVTSLQWATPTSTTLTFNTNRYIARRSDGVKSGTILFTGAYPFFSNNGFIGTSTGTSSLNEVDPSTTKLVFGDILLGESSGGTYTSYRGKLRGIYSPAGNLLSTRTSLDTFSESSDTYIIFKPYNTAFVIKTSGSW